MKSRRGLSTVVGMVFAIIAIITSIGYVTFSMNLLDQYNQAVLSRNQGSIDKGSENFQIYSAKIYGGKFNITIANTGNLPINITRMWVQNTTTSDWVNFYTINKLVNPGSLLINIGQSSPVGANAAYAYNLKLVTSRGNTMQFTLGSPGVKPLFMQLSFIPQQVTVAGQNATLLYTVTNNMTSSNLLTNIQPNTLPTATCTGTASLTNWIGPLPAQYPNLPSGSTVIFKWNFKFTGGVSGDKCSITASLKNGIASNFAYDAVTRS